MAHSRSIVLSCFVAAIAACSGDKLPPPPAAAVQVSELETVQGVPDRGDDPAVVAIIVNGTSLCTGSLIAPDVVLTARHCVAQPPQSITCPSTTAQIGADLAPGTLRILSGDDVTSATQVAVGRAIVTPTGDVLCDADIAAIILDQPVAGVTPLPLSTTAVAVGGHVRSVGFGATSDASAAGLKIVREHVAVQSVTTDEFQVGEAACQGDSGGPAFDETTGAIVGVVSRGGGTCTGKKAYNIYTRVDAFESLLAHALALGAGDVADAGADAATTKKDAGAAKPPPSDVGTSCTAASDCAAGVCVTSSGSGYCSRACGTGDRCPTHYRCTKTPDEATSVCMQSS